MTRGIAALVWLGLGACGSLPAGGGADDDAAIPDKEFCDPVSDWSEAWAAWEAAVIEDVRDLRAEGAHCGALGEVPGAQDVQISGPLTCAARAHATDMAVRDFFGHDDPDGVGPNGRVAAAGGMFLGVHEDLLGGALDPDQVTAVWLATDQQCADLLYPDFDRIGVGYYGGTEGKYDGYLVLLLGQAVADL